MTALITQEIGSFRKPDYLAKEFHKIERTPKFTELAERATRETLEVFERSGLDNIGIGGEMFRWEMYEHPAERIKGIIFYGMVRSFDNRYYRKGSAIDRLERREPFHVDEVKFVAGTTKKPLKVPITGPYTMMEWSFNDYYDSREDLAMEFARIINEELKDIASVWKQVSGGRRLEIQIDEPATTTHPDEMDIVVDSINRSVQGVDGEISMHVCYSSDYRLLYDRIPDLKIDGYNLEYSNRDTLERGLTDDKRVGFQDLKYFAQINESLQRKKFIGIGVTDVHIDYVEPVELIEDRINYALKIIGDPDLVRINPDCGLRTRSREIGEQKLRNMVMARNNILKQL
ncbi:methionine synthase (cobalamin-independent) related protein [Thermoplasma acidophilum]|uniref:Methionine synthase n=1 Tax=Thermoplasma acidophilum (strain ATCC 25905 / DSM 1728 / JCM 9062 / NBRC 15155 / AMRC-C165) TaxID=273075 RepID=METE_THEAC|nr:methionine synthase [Thermoplasma acidophilum]P57704.1 RecName: Full=Methionine synthase; AltName: Full=Homocysteine methyltransferase [Thermoplasma acidophilum DSM 1728]CAC12106.1 methionine synthase (cobalamin-independent) related protein [Thermoplasma acidophilum]